MFSHGDHVEFFDGAQWRPGTVYVAHRDTVVIMADQPSELIEVISDQVRHVEVR